MYPIHVVRFHHGSLPTHRESFGSAYLFLQLGRAEQPFFAAGAPLSRRISLRARLSAGRLQGSCSLRTNRPTSLRQHLVRLFRRVVLSDGALAASLAYSDAIRHTWPYRLTAARTAPCRLIARAPPRLRHHGALDYYSVHWMT